MESAKVIYVIETKSTRGDGTSANPSRQITKYWNFDGKLLFEEDPVKQGYIIKSPRCGRDKNGVFHCVCGNCQESTF